MASVANNVVYLGNFATGIPDIDPNGTGSAENASALVGTTFTGAEMSIQTLIYEDGNSNNFIDFDQPVSGGSDYLSYDIGNGPQSSSLDQAVWYNVTITDSNNNEISTSAMVLQTASGETFLNEFSGSLDNLSIQSIEIGSVINNQFSREQVDRSMDGTTIVCFGAGSMIDTPNGKRAVETLRPGDFVYTLDHGKQQIQSFFSATTKCDSTTAPIVIPAGSLAPDMPQSTLILSPQHRILCRSVVAERMFDTPEILIPAKRFVGEWGILQRPGGTAQTYYHFYLPIHDIVVANGAFVESCFLGEEALKLLPAAASLPMRDELPCRLVPKGHQQKTYINRLVQNEHRVFQPGHHPIRSASQPA